MGSHSKSLIHRDGFMGNILRGTKKSPGPKLVDFGMHKFVTDTNNEYKVYGTKRQQQLPHITQLIQPSSAKKGPQEKDICQNVDKNTMLAVDMWSAVYVLFSLITRDNLVNKKARWRHFTHEKITQKVNFWITTPDSELKRIYGVPAFSKKRREILEQVVLPLINQIGWTPDNILKIQEELLTSTSKLGKPIHDLLGPSTEEEQKEFDQAYDAKFPPGIVSLRRRLTSRLNPTQLLKRSKSD